MLIKEYRVVNNCTQSEYQIGQLYATAMASKEQTGGGEGVEVIKNEPYEKENGEKGQYTYKIFRLASRVPGFVRALAPAGALDLYEEAWNAYPYCKTVLKNGYMKDNFSIVYETLHVDKSRGELTNALKISDADLKKREVILIDVANDKVDPKEYKPQEDPRLVHSTKTGRGPLTEKDWIKTCEPVMTCYKLVYIEFKWFGLQGKVESFLSKTIHNLFLKFHRQLFCWMDQWYGMSIQDIRDLEEQIKKDLDVQRKEGPAVVVPSPSDSASIATSTDGK
ncbi:phosphatidylinositol transfer protein alphaisoform [Lichtheimia corymbifera JMRC:FSU:9682]|uniref:Phosphatidylinositol transfer protein alphaisoform n=1 Tax=Lichtheimia corymbifera JMRC:FSU:9682 TaxID=1263082 RepID=A0A068RKK1_9FUNG|nr:phosphatidylinositol transfer protein alphaisoform [Lichtheimia corymbifera JMRC:FSU:9682]